jgi:glycosidase
VKRNSPPWLADSFFYEVYPQSFLDANGDGIGEPLYAEKNKYPFIYRRKLGAETILVAVNPSQKPGSVEVALKCRQSHPIPLDAHGATIRRTKSEFIFQMQGISHGIFKI